MGSVPEKPPEPVRQPEYLTSSTVALVEETKRWLVCELFLRRGTFWERVRACRMDWDITPIIGLPSTTDGSVLWPENKPEHSFAAVSPNGVINMNLSKEEHKRIKEHNKSVEEFEGAWNRDLHRIVESTVPSELGGPRLDETSHIGLGAGGRRFGSLYGFWMLFTSACVLYDPPETALIPFAGYAHSSLTASRLVARTGTKTTRTTCLC
jgi:hypothetical protein